MKRLLNGTEHRIGTKKISSTAPGTTTSP